jgi:hypothetical protein
MNLDRRREFILISLPVAFVLLAMILIPAFANSGKTITTVGGNVIEINDHYSITLRFSPDHPIFVHQGQTIVLTEASNDVHTLSLVDKSLLPKTVGDVFSCAPPQFGGSPNSICARIFATHLPNGIPQGPPPPNPPPGKCITVGGQTPVYQCIDNGVPSSTPPKLDTAFTFSKGGDSVILLPGETITMTVTASPGSILHFMCVLHPWMQGEIIVTSGNGEDN